MFRAGHLTYLHQALTFVTDSDSSASRRRPISADRRDEKGLALVRRLGA